jgi:hypothetical protein
MTKIKAKISQREFDSEYIKEQLKWINDVEWTRDSWIPKPALLDKKGNVTHLYTGQKFDPKYFDLSDDAWDHDHCDICSNKIMEGDIYADGEGQILCDQCFIDFVENEGT